MQKLILDYSKWRCGGTGDYKLGKGSTELLNSQGFMCCLGQFSLQLDKTLTENQILGRSMPEDLKRPLPDLVEQSGMDDDKSIVYDTRLTNDAVSINDDPLSTPETKIKNLTELFKQNGYEIEVINKP